MTYITENIISMGFPAGDMSSGFFRYVEEKEESISVGVRSNKSCSPVHYINMLIYILDDPFSDVDVHTSTSLFNEYIMGALSWKTVLLVNHHMDFLHAFNSVLLISDGKILHVVPYNQLLASSCDFQGLVNAHKQIAGTERLSELSPSQKQEIPAKGITSKTRPENKSKTYLGDKYLMLLYDSVPKRQLVQKCSY